MKKLTETNDVSKIRIGNVTVNIQSFFKPESNNNETSLTNCLYSIANLKLKENASQVFKNPA